jgi:HlyD family secretion protein
VTLAVYRDPEPLLGQATETERSTTTGDLASPRAGEVTTAYGLPQPLIPRLPVVVESQRRWRTAFLLGALLLIAAASGAYWWQQSREPLPPGIASSNGRLEADEIDIGTKFAGRVADILVQEGDMVMQGQIIARMDTKDLEASLKQAQAQILQAQGAIEEARAAADQQRASVALAKLQFDRTNYLVQRGHVSQENLDLRRQQLDSANAALTAAIARIAQAERAREAEQQQADLIKVNIADNTLVAPRDGRIQYRVANLGEVLPAGGKVVTMLDVASVYMDVFLPTLDAGRVAIGDEARLVLDAYPNIVIPATVSFIAGEAQFTPKMVETRTERERLMFRIRVRIDAALLKAHAAEVRSGLPGIAYVRVDTKLPWPAPLQPAT